MNNLNNSSKTKLIIMVNNRTTIDSKSVTQNQENIIICTFALSKFILHHLYANYTLISLIFQLKCTVCNTYTVLFSLVRFYKQVRLCANIKIHGMQVLLYKLLYSSVHISLERNGNSTIFISGNFLTIPAPFDQHKLFSISNMDLL